MNIDKKIVFKIVVLSLSVVTQISLSWFEVRAQEESSFITAEEQTTYISPNSKTDPLMRENDMLAISLSSIYSLSVINNVDTGIKGTVDPDGLIKIELFSYDPTSADGFGSLIYGMRLLPIEGRQSVDTGEEYLKSAPYIAIKRKSILEIGDVYSDNIQQLVLKARLFSLKDCGYTFYQNLYRQFDSYAFPCDPKMKILNKIIIKLTIKNATLKAFKLPIIGQLGGDFFTKRAILRYKVNNGEFKTLDKNSFGAELSLPMGSKITLEYKVNGSVKPRKPKINGVPDVWIARFAGDLMYYCSPSITPGDWKPWIGYDSRVHNLMVRKYPDDFELKYPDWRWEDVKKAWTYTFHLERRSNDDNKLNEVFSWPKYHIVNGKKQRRNQKEGLNMQYLNYWDNNWNKISRNNFKKYNGKVNYMLGFDDDELAFFNSSIYQAANAPLKITTNGKKIAKLEDLPWKHMPEGNSVVYDSQNYPLKGVALNEMVTSYKLHKAEPGLEFKVPYYNGYEIQDRGTNADFPNGKGEGNVVHPGLVSVSSGSDFFNLFFKVSAPFETDKGFYSMIEGTQWPSHGEADVPYTLTGLRARLDLDNFILEYEWMNRLGTLTKVTKKLSDENDNKKKEIARTGRWTVKFDLAKPAYSSITAYYQIPGNKRVAIAGKELKSIFMLMTGVKNLYSKNNKAVKSGEDAKTTFSEGFKEGDGHGAKIWQEDYRTSKSGEYTEARQFGNNVRYTKPYTRKYVFRKEDRVLWTAFDGDPHLWVSDETEYYLGSRTMAKRVPNDSIKQYLKFQIADVNSNNYTVIPNNEHISRTAYYSFNAVGTFKLKVSYRNTSFIEHLIVVKDYKGDDERGEIIVKELTAFEAKALKLDPSNYVKITLNNVLSNYKYSEGYRATNFYTKDDGKEYKPNRWANFNDYADSYLIEVNYVNGNDRLGDRLIKPGQVGEIKEQIVPEAKRFVDSYDEKVLPLLFVWKEFGFHYSSNWLRRNGPNNLQTLPPYIDDSNVKRIYKTGEELNEFDQYIKTYIFEGDNKPVTSKYQYVVPLLSYSTWQGWRSRTNPSCIYDIKYLFNSPNGAFSGDPILPANPNDIQAPDYSDTLKDLQELYFKLKGLRILIVPRDGMDQLKPDDNIAFRQISKLGTGYDTLLGSTRVTNLKKLVSTNNSDNNPGANPKSMKRRLARSNPDQDNDNNIKSNTLVYPNSSFGKFTIVIGSDIEKIEQIYVRQLSGKQVYEKRFNQNKRINSVTININGNPKGLYIISLVGYNGIKLSKRVILL